MFKIVEIEIQLPEIPEDGSRNHGEAALVQTLEQETTGALQRRSKSSDETKRVQPSIKDYLEELGYEVHKEKRAFHISHLHYALNQRVDFLAFKGQDAYIVECKGSDLRLAHVFPAILQITLYMRLYKMLQSIPNPQLVLDEELNPSLVRKGFVYGKLAVPASALNSHKIRRALDQVYQSLAKTNLLEANVEIWAIIPKSSG